MSDEITGYPDHFIINGDTTSCPCAEHSPKSARAELERQALNVGSPEYDVWFGLLLDRYRDEVQREQSRRNAAKVQDAMEKVRAADWGRSSRSKRPYLQGMEAAKREITKASLRCVGCGNPVDNGQAHGYGEEFGGVADDPHRPFLRWRRTPRSLLSLPARTVWPRRH